MVEDRAQLRDEIGTLRQQVLALADADCVLPEDGGALVAALDAALWAAGVGDARRAQAAIERFIAGTRALIAAGSLAGRDGDPPLAAARALLMQLCHELKRRNG